MNKWRNDWTAEEDATFERQRETLEDIKNDIYDSPEYTQEAYEQAQENIDRHFRTHGVYQD
jgi:hypothetical protein